jgi:hypothetical protein
MRNALDTLDATFLEMRWRTLSLAADLDRVQRGDGGASALNDPRLTKLRQAFDVLLNAKEDRAAQVQMIFSDQSQRIGDGG